MKKILIIFAHPAFETSRVNRLLIQGLDTMAGITFHDLYQAYPEMDIDKHYEQNLMEQHDTIVFHHPFFWYSVPALLKEWQDLVLAHGWAYGAKGNALMGKLFFNVISTGGLRRFYSTKSRYTHYTVRQLLVPIEQTMSMCKMTFLPPFVIHGTHSITRGDIMAHKHQYDTYLALFRDEMIDLEKLLRCDYLNDYLVKNVEG